MQSFTMYQVDAFANRPFTGNPAAVLILDRPMEARLMQAIAAENALSETAFVVRSDGAYNIRWFTPSHEAAFCGHATLASAHVLASAYGAEGAMRFETQKVGALTVSRLPDGRYALDLPRLDPTPAAPPELFRRIFQGGWRRAVRNFENWFVEIESPDAVVAFQPPLQIIAEMGETGLCITAAGGQTHTGAPVDFVSRYFCPGGGIDEDPVTGSTHASLAPFWVERLGRSDLSAFQASRRGGEIGISVTEDRVVLSGGAVTFMKAQIYPA
ncbi:PhzF family phenazine biosynthesis protein [Frigidibacter sp. RF13]|uniref:PhzF family phenazine biosynthesis protein n=1 Tax=Frigidibacter sp. RF13 TaxID=2997340 RepID=UPI00227011EA|nr:PhzF family phenazine biosynthesis protein [Frigidibacter sp. RF13]MCY1127938.1 PhzF family phenazine biosynthesis protein [Frigidibacter sp. RF13]